jgi:hypothetical protein
MPSFIDVVEHPHFHQDCGLLVTVIAAPNSKTIHVEMP